jgi:hypothetical protein
MVENGRGSDAATRRQLWLAAELRANLARRKGLERARRAAETPRPGQDADAPVGGKGGDGVAPPARERTI